MLAPGRLGGADRRASPSGRTCRRRRSGRCARRVVNGASPSQDAPSPPIWVKRGGLAVHPLDHEVAADPGHAPCEPSGTLVEVLCGQPGQNQGSRTRRRRRSGQRGAAPLQLGQEGLAASGRPSAPRSARPAPSRHPVVSSWPCEGRDGRRRARPACREPWVAPAARRASPWPGSRSGLASPRRPRQPGPGRRPPAAPAARAARSCRPCRRARPARAPARRRSRARPAPPTTSCQRLAGRHDAEPVPLRAAQHDPVEPVGARERAAPPPACGRAAAARPRAPAAARAVGPADVAARPAAARSPSGATIAGCGRLDRDRGRALDRVVDRT